MHRGTTGSGTLTAAAGKSPPRIQKGESTMEPSHINVNILTHTAIAALKNAYQECSDKAAKESIITAFKAVIQLHNDLGNDADRGDAEDGGYDPGEYCAAV